MADELCLKMPDFHVTFRDLLHAVNVRHGTDGFTSPPKEGVLRIFRPEKSDGFGRVWTHRTWVLKASTLPVDHRSRFAAHIRSYSRKKNATFNINQNCDCSVKQLVLGAIHSLQTRTIEAAAVHCRRQHSASLSWRLDTAWHKITQWLHKVYCVWNPPCPTGGYVMW